MSTVSLQNNINMLVSLIPSMDVDRITRISNYLNGEIVDIQRTAHQNNCLRNVNMNDLREVAILLGLQNVNDTHKLATNIVENASREEIDQTLHRVRYSYGKTISQ